MAIAVHQMGQICCLHINLIRNPHWTPTSCLSSPADRDSNSPNCTPRGRGHHLLLVTSVLPLAGLHWGCEVDHLWSTKHKAAFIKTCPDCLKKVLILFLLTADSHPGLQLLHVIWVKMSLLPGQTEGERGCCLCYWLASLHTSQEPEN